MPRIDVLIAEWQSPLSRRVACATMADGFLDRINAKPGQECCGLVSLSSYFTNIIRAFPAVHDLRLRQPPGWQPVTVPLGPLL